MRQKNIMLNSRNFNQNIIASVIMSVYNTEEIYLRKAIESILDQTFHDFEFLIFDDACNEKTKEVLHSYTDKRIKIITNIENHGLTYNLNRGLEMASGKYIVRMDADDISVSERIEKLIACMEQHSTINVMGSYVMCGDFIAKYDGNIPQPLRKALLLLNNKGLAHPSIIIRKEFLDRYGIRYNENIKRAQDYELWTQCILYTNLYVYPECLLYYRIHEGQVSQKYVGEQEDCCLRIKYLQFEKFKPALSEKEINDFITSRKHTELKISEYKKIESKIKRINNKKGFYSKGALAYALRENYIRYIKYNYKWLYRISKMGIMYLDVRFLKYSIVLALCKNTKINKYMLSKEM